MMSSAEPPNVAHKILLQVTTVGSGRGLRTFTGHTYSFLGVWRWAGTGGWLSPPTETKRVESFAATWSHSRHHAAVVRPPAGAEATKGGFGLPSTFGQIDGLRPGFDFLVVGLAHFLQNIAHLVHPAALVPGPGIHARYRRRQSGTAVGDDQREVPALQPAPVQILQQSLPVRLTLSLAAQESQQMAGAVAPHPIGHQHLYPLASPRTPHPQAHTIQKQVRILVAQLGLVKL